MSTFPKDLLLIPALFCDEALYADVAPGLSEVAAVRVVAAPRDTMAESVEAILAEAPQTFVLGGTSYGASLAIEVALAAPDRVKGLWIMGADHTAPDAEQMKGLVHTVDTNTDGAIEYLSGAVVLSKHTAQAETFKTMAKRVGHDTALHQIKALAAKRSFEGEADNLRMPVLAIWGEGDAIAPAAKAQAFVATLPHAEWHALPECGHLPTLEQPAEVVRIVKAWLAQAAAAA